MACICFKWQIFVNKGKFGMKCIEKYDASAEGVSRKFLDMPIDHRNLLWNINFLKFPWLSTKFQTSLTNSKIPWLFPDLEFPWPVATLPTDLDISLASEKKTWSSTDSAPIPC